MRFFNRGNKEQGGFGEFTKEELARLKVQSSLRDRLMQPRDSEFRTAAEFQQATRNLYKRGINFPIEEAVTVINGLRRQGWAGRVAAHMQRSIYDRYRANAGRNPFVIIADDMALEWLSLQRDEGLMVEALNLTIETILEAERDERIKIEIPGIAVEVGVMQGPPIKIAPQPGNGIFTLGVLMGSLKHAEDEYVDPFSPTVGYLDNVIPELIKNYGKEQDYSRGYAFGQHVERQLLQQGHSLRQPGR